MQQTQKCNKICWHCGKYYSVCFRR